MDVEVQIYGRPLIRPANAMRNIKGYNARSLDTSTCLASGLLKLGFSIKWVDLKKYPEGKLSGKSPIYVLPRMYPRSPLIKSLHDSEGKIGIHVDAPMVRGSGYEGFRSLFLVRPDNKSLIGSPQRASEIGLIHCSKKKNTPERVLIAAPGLPHKPWESTFDWAKDKVNRIIQVGLDCAVRCHPLDPTYHDKKWSKLPLDKVREAGDSVSRSRFLVVAASSIALEAFLRGIPVVCDHHALFRGACCTFEQAINSPEDNFDKVQEALDKISLTQWAPEEIVEGLPILAYARYKMI